MSSWFVRAAAVLAAALLTAPPVVSPAALPVASTSGAATGTWSAPASPATPSSVLRAFDPPPRPWSAGHRGVDWAAPSGQVLSPGPGAVRFVGAVAGRQVITVAHPNGMLSSLEPVEPDPALAAGDRVAAGDVLGTVEEGVDHCPAACVHWGVRIPDGWRVDGAVWDRYVDPLVLLGWAGPSVLWPLEGGPPG